MSPIRFVPYLSATCLLNPWGPLCGLSVCQQLRRIPLLSSVPPRPHLQLLAKQARLGQLKTGAVLVSKAERDKAVKQLSAALECWRKRKAMFRNIWYGSVGREYEV